jgi:hypothetical protein
VTEKRNYGTHGIHGNYGIKRIFSVNSVNSVYSVVSLLCSNVVWFDLVRKRDLDFTNEVITVWRKTTNKVVGMTPRMVE